MSSAATFTLRGDQRARAVDALGSLGFVTGQPHPLRTTVLDTFDGRLHDAGLRLALHDGAARDLWLTGEGVVPTRLVLPAVPRFARDLPPGPFRSRIGSIIEVRALLPQVLIVEVATTLSLRDASGKTVASATVHDDLRVADHEGVHPLTVLELHEVVGFPKHARRAGDAVVALGLERVDGDAVTALCDAAGVDLRGHQDSPSVALDPRAPAIEGMRDVLAHLAASIEANWQGTIDEIDPEFLHDLRVAVRRTRAVLGQGKHVLPPDLLGVARERFAWLGTLTGPARDLDVYLIEWDRYAAPLGAAATTALEPVRELLEARSHLAHRELEERLASREASDLMAVWHQWLATFVGHEPHGRDAHEPLGPVVRSLIGKAQQRLVQRGRLIDEDSPAERLHDLRKDAKKLRYLLECFGSLLPPVARKQFVQRLKAFQDNLGEHQDAEVHVALIREIADELHRRPGCSPDTLLAMGQLMERLEQIRLATRAEFSERFADYDRAKTRRALEAALEGLHP